MLGNFLKIDFIVVCFLKPVNSACFFMGNDGLSSKQVGSQASRRVIQRLAWIQPVCISMNAVPALKGLILWKVCSNVKDCEELKLPGTCIMYSTGYY